MGDEFEPTGDGNNPAWEDVLGVIPEEFHSQVTPYFQQWDQSAQSKIEQANSQLKDFEAYKPFAEHNITAEEIEQGLRLSYEISQNPQSVYEALGNAYNLNSTSNAGNNPEEDNEEDNSSNFEDPRFGELQNGLNLVSQIVLQEQQAKEAAKQDAELDQELNQLKEKFGDYDQEYVLAKMEHGMSGEDAVKAYHEFVNQVRNSAPPAPNILGGNSGGSGVPSNRIDTTKLSGKDTRSLVAQMLDASNRSSQ